MFLLISTALAQWPTFEPPSNAPTLAPWQGTQDLGVGMAFIGGLGGDGTTLTDTDFPGPGWLDAFVDFQLGVAYRASPRVDVISNLYFGTGSIAGGGLGVRYWAMQSEIGRVGVQVDVGALYLRLALPVAVTPVDHVTLYFSPTVQAAVGAQARCPIGVSWNPATRPQLVVSAETGMAMTALATWPPEYDQGMKYYAALSATYRGTLNRDALKRGGLKERDDLSWDNLKQDALKRDDPSSLLVE